jgi:hypothetical protein
LARRISPIVGARRLHWTGAVLAAIALLLRIAVPAPPPALAADTGALAGLFDEHVLCRTVANDASAPREAPVPAPAQHDHDNSGCCLWHAVAGAGLLPSTAAQPVVFAAAIVGAPASTISWTPARLAGIARARAPPPRA